MGFVRAVRETLLGLLVPVWKALDQLLWVGSIRTINKQQNDQAAMPRLGG